MRHSARPVQTTRGFTMVELLVALVLGLVLIGGALNMVVTNRNTVQLTENVMRVQENARTAFEFMARDIRETGQIPCGIPDTPNSVSQIGNVIRSPKTSSTIPWWADWTAGTLRGFTGTTDTPGTVAFGTGTHERVNGTAALITMQAGGGDQVIASHDPSTFEMTLQSTDGFNKADVVVACDLKSAVILQLDKYLDPTATVINYTPGDTVYNCSDDLGAPTPANCGTTVTKTFAANGLVAPLKTTFWYIGFNAQGNKSLYRTYLKMQPTSVVAEAQEVLPGVIDLQFEYLTINPATHLLATDWVEADSIADWSKAAADQVVGVKLTLTFETEDAVSSTQTKLQRQSVHVVTLRSRGSLL